MFTESVPEMADLGGCFPRSRPWSRTETPETAASACAFQAEDSAQPSSTSAPSNASSNWASPQAPTSTPCPEGRLRARLSAPRAGFALSGGSLTCAEWAIAEAQAKAENRTLDFARDIAHPILALTGTDLRTGPLAKKLLLPWNWFRGAYATNAMVDKFEAAFGKGTLNLLPDHPRFVFCATDMAFGASFIFDRDRVGSYLAPGPEESALRPRA